jgi:hypothetical protein
MDYRRNVNDPGASVGRIRNPDGGYSIQVVGQADDYTAACDGGPLNYFQAYEKVAALTITDGTIAQPPVTVKQALENYIKELELHGRSTVLAQLFLNRRLANSPLLQRPVPSLQAKELKEFRNGLLTSERTAVSVDRAVAPLRAALYHAAKHDSRITNAWAWRVGLEKLGGRRKARHYDNMDVLVKNNGVERLVNAAYGICHQFGVYVHVIAHSGCRPSQAHRIRVDGVSSTHLIIPASDKGNHLGREDEKPPVRLPLVPELALRLQAECAGRDGSEQLLRRPDGRSWGDGDPFLSAAIESAGLDPGGVIAANGIKRRQQGKTRFHGKKPFGLYALRHASIINALMKGLSPAIVAKNHDTSIQEIQDHYAFYITDFTEELIA